jgi:hypothetical protein
VQISGTSGRKKKVAMQTGREITPSMMKSLLFSISIECILGNISDLCSPLPTFEASNASEMINGSHQVSREHSCDRTTCVKDTGSLGEFVLTIPRADDVLHTGIKGAFSKTWHHVSVDSAGQAVSNSFLPTRKRMA